MWPTGGSFFPSTPSLADQNISLSCFPTGRHVKSFHEAQPKMSGEFIEMINSKPFELVARKTAGKGRAIAQDSARWPAQSDLRRDPITPSMQNIFRTSCWRTFVVSMSSFCDASWPSCSRVYRIGYFSSLNPGAINWMSSPTPPLRRCQP